MMRIAKVTLQESVDKEQLAMDIKYMLEHKQILEEKVRIGKKAEEELEEKEAALKEMMQIYLGGAM